MELRLWRRDENLRHVVAASNQRHDRRSRLFVEILDDGVSGWGEVSPLTVAIGPDPSIDDVENELVGKAFRVVRDVCRREGELPEWARVHLMANASAVSRWSFAAIEMAILDLFLTRSSRSLVDLWSVDVATVTTMATTSLIDFDPQWEPPVDATRLRVKTSPSVVIEQYADSIARWNLPVLLDFNSSARSFDEVVVQIHQLQQCAELVAVEQPFALGDLASHAQLANVVPVAVSLDESVRSLMDLRTIARYRAASMVCVKPTRVGGLACARAILAEAATLRLRAYVGGFFESPLARSAHRAVAAGFGVEPSDVGIVGVDGSRGELYTFRPVGIGYEPAREALELRTSLVVG